MPVGQRKTVYTNSVTNNIPVPMRKAISRNCTSLPPIPMSATICPLCWRAFGKADIAEVVHSVLRGNDAVPAVDQVFVQLVGVIAL